MEQFDLYRDIAERTDGDIYIGVVGPVRTGKSTFIKRFMDLMVIPKIMNDHKKERAIDELPQGASGRTIMTTQPKFVPNEAVKIDIGDNTSVSVRLVDCVGYLVDGAIGHLEEDQPRMVRTPWFTHDIPFEKAAELGTRKVISEHSTIGMVVTTDGSITEIPRGAYVKAEEQVVRELDQLKKPYIIILNSVHPDDPETRKLGSSLEGKYGVPVVCCNVMEMDKDEINDIMGKVLFEFPVKEIHIDVPKWVQALPKDHYLVREILESVRAFSQDLTKMNQNEVMLAAFQDSEYIDSISLEKIEPGEGSINYKLAVPQDLFYKVVGEECGCEIKGDYHLVSLLRDLVSAKKEYERIASALDSVRSSGYGIVAPTMEEMTLEEPEIVKHGSRFGVKLKASAPSLHLIRVDIQTEISPIMGSEKQSEELVKYLLSEFESDTKRIWKSNIFGKSLQELVQEGVTSKLARMPEDARRKMQCTLERIVNDGGGGLILILI
ncbi:MAG TPA: stage IV sporulation protein A [Clostridia bacterium]|nr:stage IV sporulation protein A [Clostridia bacterium]